MSERKRSAAGPAGADKRGKPVVDLVAVEEAGPVVAEVVEVEPVESAEDAEPAEDAEDDEADQALADIDPATDEELDAIARDIGRPAPATSTALARRDPMGQYMAEVRRYPLLTREEEHELAVRWIDHGDKEAGRRLVTSNLRLVVKIAHEYKRTYQNLLDLVQEGNVGLIQAVKKFDPYRGVKLSTYSGWWIRAYILKFILNNWRLVKIGTTQNQRKLFFNLRKQREKLLQAGVDPTAERIAKELDVSESEVIEMDRRLSSPDMSLNAPLNEDDGDGGRTRLDIIEDSTDDPAMKVESAEFKDILQEKLRRFGATLAGRELEIFRDRIVADDPVTLQELGDRWKVSRERARQLEKRMVLRLREFLQSELGDAVQIALGQE
ncbi:RNA polymerase factor sigma-32 [Nannocystis sp.]|uniref:RNA polymerase factor sigma-32 n=1 Tax=Nannocystis sp. TaxID=1962667 RepID=UPI0024269945|nr:RNA polymerase factor sigma-32 [Nannocystis sp.]MBK7824863.1 RNA polymerase factor sigma-32 [Nannocystis sp.]MBK9752882.1 RNA polymerase factor sigma-32 [Nannocystis sp.]